MAVIQHFRDLRAWQQCRDVRLRIRILVRSWPKDERFRLIDQIIRSSRGPTSHIAEGYGRFHAKDNVRFCLMARGSLFETQDHLITAQDEDYISEAEFKECFDMAQAAIRTVNGYIKYLESMSAPRSNFVSEPSPLYGNSEPPEQQPPSAVGPLEADI